MEMNTRYILNNNNETFLHVEKIETCNSTKNSYAQNIIFIRFIFLFLIIHFNKNESFIYFLTTIWPIFAQIWQV